MDAISMSILLTCLVSADVSVSLNSISKHSPLMLIPESLAQPFILLVAK